jgi:hypothetical protein
MGPQLSTKATSNVAMIAAQTAIGRIAFLALAVFFSTNRR